MAEELMFDFGSATDNQVDTRTSPLETATDPVKKGKGTTPNFSADFNASIDSAIQDIYAVPYQSPLQKALSGNGPKSMGFAPESMTDQYMYQEGFESRYFNPFDTTNYQKWADKETWGSALGKGWDSFGYKFGNTFTDYWKGYGRMAEALFTLDWDKMRPDEATMMDQYYKDQIDMKKNFVFEKPENEDSIFSKRTMSEFIGNAGFALGTFAGLGLEIAADIAITALTGGAGAETFALTAANQAARASARAAAKQGMFGSAKVFGREVLEGFGKLGTKSVDDLAHLNKIREAETIASAGASPLRTAMAQTFESYSTNWLKAAKSKSFAEFGENLLKGTPLIGTGVKYGERVAAAVKGGATAGQITGLTLQGLRRVGQEMNMAATEASFEAVTSYGDTLDKMVKQYKIDNNGAVPTAEEFEKMRSLSMKASASNFNTNMAILLATNKLQFGTLFNKFLPASMIAGEMADQALKVEAKVAGKMLRQQYVKGLTGTYGVLGQVAKDFGKKEALYQFGKAFAKDALAFEVVEGLQENLQETTASGWRDYYAGQMNGAKYTLGEAFGKGAEEQFSKQGLKTFLMGALTGSIIRLPTAVASRSLDAANKAVINRQYQSDPEANPLKKSEKQFKDDIALQNSLYRQAHEGKFSQRMFNFNAQMSAAQNTTNAVATGSKYEFENGKDNALLAAVSSAKRTHSIDMLEKAIAEMGTDMTAEDFEKSFGYKLEDTKYSSAKEFTEQVARDVKKYSKVIDNVTSHVKNKLANPYNYEPKSRGRYITALTRQAQEDAIQFIALNAVKSEMTAERAKSLASEILAIPGMKNSADYAIRTLTNPSAVGNDFGYLRSELMNLENSIKAEGLDEETKKSIQSQIDLKKEEIKLINKWDSYFSKRKDILGVDEEGDAITEDNTFVFVGKEIEEEEEIINENGETVKTGKKNKVYKIDHTEVLDTFRKLMNIRNKQAGSNEEISEQALLDSFEKIYDFMSLNQDVADYMRSTDMLMNPENYQRTIARILDGKFKSGLIVYYQTLFANAGANLEQKFEDMHEQYGIFLSESDKTTLRKRLVESIIQNESYKNLLTLISDVNVGVEQSEYGNSLTLELNKAFTDEINKIVEDVTGVVQETTQEESTTTPTTNEQVEAAPGTEGFNNAPVNAGDEDREEPVADNQEATSTPPVVEQPAETQQVTESSDETFDLNKTEADQANMAFLMPDQATPFAVTGTEETGFDVVDQNNNTVTNEKIDSLEKAQELSDSLNTTRTNLDFAQEILLPLLTTETEDIEQKMIKFIDRAVDSMNRYNKRTKSNVESLEEYYKVPVGKKAINRLAKAIATGKPMEVEAAKPVIIEPTSASQLQLFETTATPSNSASLTLEGLQTLHSQIQQALKPEKPEVQAVSDFANDMFPLSPPQQDGKAFGKVDGAHIRDVVIEKDGVVYVGYKNIVTEVIDIYFAAQSETEYLGYMRVYENGKPTERFTSKLESSGKNKAKIKEMITNLQSMLPAYHEYSEDISVSTDGLRWFVNQLKNGYELLLDANNEVVTTTVSINGAAIVNELGVNITGDNAQFDNLPLTNQQDFNKAKEVIEKYLKQMGVTEPIVRWGSVGNAMTARFNLPVLVKRPGVISAPEMQQVSEKSSKFVEGGIVTEESILDELRKITECFS